MKFRKGVVKFVIYLTDTLYRFRDCANDMDTKNVTKKISILLKY